MQKIKKCVTGTLVISATALSACSTMFNSGSQTIIARSTGGKEGIQVEVTTPSGAYTTKLPATIAAESSWDGVKVRVIDKCYDSTATEVNKGITLSFWANIFNSGVGFFVDLATGKLWKYDTNVSVPVNAKTMDNVEGCESA